MAARTGLGSVGAGGAGLCLGAWEWVVSEEVNSWARTVAADRRVWMVTVPSSLAAERSLDFMAWDMVMFARCPRVR